MNKTITSEKDILDISKRIASEKGLQAITMRSVAKECDVAVGSIYNYYASKNDLLIATIASIWQEIIQDNLLQQSSGFIENVQRLFECIQSGSKKYPFFFSLHSISLAENGKEKGRMAMHQYFQNIKKYLLTSLKEDKNIKKDVFNQTFQEEQFIDFVFSNLISLLLHKEQSCDFLLIVIQKIIY